MLKHLISMRAAMYCDEHGILMAVRIATKEVLLEQTEKATSLDELKAVVYELIERIM
jgi:hypothetical protein